MDQETRSKNVHVKLDRLTHTRFKSTLVELDASMQEAFEWFAKSVAEGNKSAVRLVEQMKRDRARAMLDGTGVRPGLRTLVRQRKIGELDPDALYDLINEGDDGDEDALPAQG